MRKWYDGHHTTVPRRRRPFWQVFVSTRIEEAVTCLQGNYAIPESRRVFQVKQHDLRQLHTVISGDKEIRNEDCAHFFWPARIVSTYTGGLGRHISVKTNDEINHSCHVSHLLLKILVSMEQMGKFVRCVIYLTTWVTTGDVSRWLTMHTNRNKQPDVSPKSKLVIQSSQSNHMPANNCHERDI